MRYIMILSLLVMSFSGCKKGDKTCGSAADKTPKGATTKADCPNKTQCDCPKPKCDCSKAGTAKKPEAKAPKGLWDNNPVLKNIHERKSVRSYKKDLVPKVTLEKLVRAGMAAPTAMNKQPWAFIVVTERKTLDALGDRLPYARMLKQAPAAIIAAGDTNLALPDKMMEFWIQDVSAAVQNVLLAAEAMGLGAVWTGVYPMEKQLEVVTEVMTLPKHIIPLAVIPVGYPKGPQKPKQKWDPKKLHWEKWGQNANPTLISP